MHFDFSKFKMLILNYFGAFNFPYVYFCEKSSLKLSKSSVSYPNCKTNFYKKRQTSTPTCLEYLIAADCNFIVVVLALGSILKVDAYAIYKAAHTVTEELDY